MTSVGVVIGCYNHERYLGGCIESVLTQTVPPDRIIVVDDSSNDDSRAIVELYATSGVELIQCDRLGPSRVYNTGVDAIDTDVVAIVSADDACLPYRLERQVEALERFGVDLILGLPFVIDEVGDLRSDALAPEFFDPFTSGRGPLLAQLFWSGNFLCAATATFRRETFLSLGGFHPGLVQLQDFYLWLRWSWRAMVLTDDRVSYYRKSPDSLSSASNNRRMNAERAWVYRRMLDEIPDSVIADSFREALPRGVRHRHRMIDIAILFLQHPDPIVYQIGCEALLDVASTDDGCTLLTGYGISMQDLFAWTARSDVLGSVERDALMRELIDRVLGIPLVK
jgi:glycosyltransferase involved in cell wall biosynthesis